MELNRESILDELNTFEKKGSFEIPPILEDYLVTIAKTGDVMFPWSKLKPLVKKKSELVMNEFYESCPGDNLTPLPNVEPFKYDVLKEKILDAIDSFPSAPFTIQRICELLTNPRRHYKRTDKFMRGLEKNILVVSTVEPHLPLQIENNNGLSVMVNGVLENATHNMDLSDPCHALDVNSTATTTHLESFTTVFPSSPSVALGHVDVNDAPVLEDALKGVQDKDEEEEDAPDSGIQSDTENASIDSTHCVVATREDGDVPCDAGSLNGRTLNHLEQESEMDTSTATAVGDSSCEEMPGTTADSSPDNEVPNDGFDSADCSTSGAASAVSEEEKGIDVLEETQSREIEGVDQPGSSSSPEQTEIDVAASSSSSSCNAATIEEPAETSEPELEEKPTSDPPSPKNTSHTPIESLPFVIQESANTTDICESASSPVLKEASEEGCIVTLPEEQNSYETSVATSTSQDIDEQDAGDSPSVLVIQDVTSESEKTVYANNKMDMEPSSSTEELVTESAMDTLCEEETRKAVEGIEVEVQAEDKSISSSSNEECLSNEAEPMEQD